MNRRQSLTQQSRFQNSALEQLKDLKLQIELKNSEIQDLKFQLDAYRKTQSIWHHLEQNYEKASLQQQRKAISQENQKLKSQVFAMLAEIERKNDTIKEQNDKINDLKSYIAQLKKLSEKSEHIHNKELQILKSSLDSAPARQMLEKEKEKMEKALVQCAKISKEMEEYYMEQIDIMNKQVDEQKNVIARLENNQNFFQNQLNRRDKQIHDLKTKGCIKEDRDKQNQIAELILRQSLQKKWQIVLTQVHQRYQKQICQLKDQIRYLILKVDSLQQNKNCYQGLTTSVLTNSKLAMSSSSNQSFRFTPNNSFSSSIKESLSKREAGSLHTPSKSSRQSNNFGYLLDRTNI